MVIYHKIKYYYIFIIIQVNIGEDSLQAVEVAIKNVKLEHQNRKYNVGNNIEFL